MRLIYTDEFKHDLRKIKDRSCQVKIKKNIQKIVKYICNFDSIAFKFQ